MTETAPSLSRILALLAQGPGLPEGDTAQGLEVVAALTLDGQLDTDAYFADPRPWQARRFRPERPDWHGELVREDEGWALRGEPAEDGPLWFLQARTLHPGNYMTLSRPDGAEFGFRIVGLTRVEPD